MPVRYIFAASIVVKIKPAISESIETSNCHTGTFPDGIRAIITIGEEKGMTLPHTEIGASGFPTAVVMMINDRRIGMVIGNIKDCASWGSSLTTLPTAANKDA